LGSPAKSTYQEGLSDGLFLKFEEFEFRAALLRLLWQQLYGSMLGASWNLSIFYIKMIKVQ
jgi:hypothetical protein